jgi:hypothetical protein
MPLLQGVSYNPFLFPASSSSSSSFFFFFFFFFFSTSSSHFRSVIVRTAGPGVA